MPAALMKHVVDPKKDILDRIGDFGKFEIFNNQVLVAVYQRPEKTASGIILHATNLDEDKYQSKVGLVLSMGKKAFVDPKGEWFDGVSVDENEWVVYRPSSGWEVTVNKVLCRILDDTAIRGKVDHPDRVW